MAGIFLFPCSEINVVVIVLAYQVVTLGQCDSVMLPPLLVGAYKVYRVEGVTIIFIAC